jgi:hypothetical protein
MTRTLAAVLAAVLALPAAAADPKGIDDEGFIRSWLLLAPFKLAATETTGDGLDKDWVKGEAKLEPKAGDKVKAGDKELVWKAQHAKDYFFDLNAHVGDVTEEAVGYAVCYLDAPAAATVTMKLGSDDECKVYLNGTEIHKNVEGRGLEKDQDTVEKVALKKGTNVLVMKVVNGTYLWSGCVRFVGADGKPVTNLTVKLAK